MGKVVCSHWKLMESNIYGRAQLLSIRFLRHFHSLQCCRWVPPAVSEKAHGDSSARNGRIFFRRTVAYNGQLLFKRCSKTQKLWILKNCVFFWIYDDLWWFMMINGDLCFFWIHLKSPLITTTNKLNSTFGQRFLAAIDPLSQLVDSSCDLTETPQQSLGAGERGDSDPLDPCYENYLLGALNHLKTASIVLKMYFWGLNLTWNIHKSSFPATNSCSPLETPLLGIAEVHLWET